MQHIKHIFFDLDHTLWDFDKNSELAFKQIFEEQKIALEFKDFIKTYVPINLKYWRLYREEKISKKELRYGRLKDVFDKLNFKVSDEFINQIAIDYLNYLPNYNYLIEGTIELLKYLHPKYKLHIITNGFKEVQSKKMISSGIQKYFNVIVTSESVGVKKPNPKVFKFALEKAKAKPEESVMIGDSLEADVLGSLACGIKPIYYSIEPNISTNKSITLVNKLLEIKQYL